MIRILHIMVGHNVFGGAERFVLSYYKYMNRAMVHFDFLFLKKNVIVENDNNDYLKDSVIYELKTWKEHNHIKDYFTTVLRLRKILKENKYDFVHINCGMWRVEICCLFAAQLAGMKNRIAHSHTAAPLNINNAFLQKGIAFLKAYLIRSLATDYFACSLHAGVHLFGETGIRSKKFKLIKNALEIQKFRCTPSEYEEIRTRENIMQNTYVFGHVGRLTKVKNHKFLIDVFEQIHMKNDNTVLWLIGSGELFIEIEAYIREKQLAGSVHMFGERQDVAELMKAMDALLFPSFYEGLSLVLVEAQVSGMKIYASDSISKEHALTDLIMFLPLKMGAKYWADRIILNMKIKDRKDETVRIKEAGYDISEAAKYLENCYQEIWSRGNHA